MDHSEGRSLSRMAQRAIFDSQGHQILSSIAQPNGHRARNIVRVSGNPRPRAGCLMAKKKSSLSPFLAPVILSLGLEAPVYCRLTSRSVGRVSIPRRAPIFIVCGCGGTPHGYCPLFLPDRDHARTALFAYIELFYNRHRIHATLDYQTPEQYEVRRACA